jgi:thioredoxin 1
MELTVEIIINSDEYVLINFRATNCDPCQMVEPTLQQVKNAIGKRIDIYVLDIDQVPNIVSKHKIKTVPMLVLFHKGEIVWQTKEILSKEEIIKFVVEFTN